MKKRRYIIIMTMLLLALAAPVRAQVFYMDDDEGPNRNVLGTNGTFSNIIVHGSTDDQTNYVPIGSGLFVMTALGSCYLFDRRKKAKKLVKE